MNKILLLASFTLAAGIAHAAPYELDATHTEVGFSVSHLVVAKAKGRFDKVTGGFEFDEAKGELSKVNIVIDVDSVNTNNADRDAHLKNSDFFETSKHPKITFVSEKVEYKDKKPVKVIGKLTMRGVTKPVTLDVDYRGTITDPRGNEKVGFGLTGKIDRQDYGVSYNKTLDKGGVAVGNEVTINIEGEANKVKAKK